MKKVLFVKLFLISLFSMFSASAQTKFIVQTTSYDPLVSGTFSINNYQVLLSAGTAPSVTLLNQYISGYRGEKRLAQTASNEFVGTACDNAQGVCVVATQSAITGQPINVVIKPADFYQPTNCTQGYSNTIPVVTFVPTTPAAPQFGIGLLGADLSFYLPNISILPVGAGQFGQQPVSNVEIDCVTLRVAYSFFSFNSSTLFGFKVADLDMSGAVLNEQVFLTGQTSYAKNVKLINNNTVALIFNNHLEIRDLSPAFNLLASHTYDASFGTPLNGVDYDQNSNHLYFLGTSTVSGVDLYSFDLTSMTGASLGLNIPINPGAGTQGFNYNSSMVLMK